MDKWVAPDNKKENTLIMQKNIMKKGEEYRDKFVINFNAEHNHLRSKIDGLLSDFMTEPVDSEESSQQVVQ